MTRIHKVNLGDHLQSSQISTLLPISSTPVAATAATMSQTAVTPHAHRVSRTSAHASALQDQTNALNAQGAAQSVFHQPLRNKKTQQAAAQLVGRLDLPPHAHARLQTRPATTALIETNISAASQSDATSVLHYHLRSDVLHALSQSLKQQRTASLKGTVTAPILATSAFQPAEPASPYQTKTTAHAITAGGLALGATLTHPVITA
jgi:hypothetical protein